MKYLNSYRVLHLDVGRPIDRPHATLAYLLVQAILVVEKLSYQAILAGLILEDRAVKRAVDQLIAKFAFARRTLLHH